MIQHNISVEAVAAPPTPPRSSAVSDAQRPEPSATSLNAATLSSSLLHFISPPFLPRCREMTSPKKKPMCHIAQRLAAAGAGEKISPQIK